jgi:hypothetical protein
MGAIQGDHPSASLYIKVDSHLRMGLIYNAFRCCIFKPAPAALLDRRLHHVVICGIGPKALQLSRSLRRCSPKRRVVMIAPAGTNEEAVFSVAAGATAIVGDAGNVTTLARAGVHRAKQLIALCPEDSTNVAVAVQARKLIAEKSKCSRGCVACFVHLADIGLRSSLQRSAVFGGSDHHCAVTSFDVFA